MSNISIHVTGVSMNSSGNLPSSTLLKESGKLMNNMPTELIQSVCEALSSASLFHLSCFFAILKSNTSPS